MRHDIQANERSFTTKEVAEELGIATPTVRKYGQILERNGYEFFKDGDRRVFVQTDVDALQAIRDTERPLNETAEDLVAQQKQRLANYNRSDIALPDTYDTLPQDPNQLREAFAFLAQELAATRETNLQLTQSLDEMKTTVSRLKQDHHVISSAIGNSSQKTQSKIEKLTNEQKTYYEALLEQEKEKSDSLQEELKAIREQQEKEWQAQNDFNKRLEEKIQKPQGTWGKLLSLLGR
ncbi:hypothetical protein [Alteribacter natronophilus]|uniref:hypothetical protein n=1 Tax=Alteribacter natronophilus TaxID=2583810 RepID=UPI00110E26C9|nr:hypothetical protein [Alteribacter natronophilus]TMW70923.1 hypothetical protein FGB90_13180 [Alteribacter natronophilus]